MQSLTSQETECQTHPTAPQQQPNLATGPTHVVKRRDRVPTDNVWLDAMRRQAVQHLDLSKASASDGTDLLVLERVLVVCSSNDDRSFTGSVGYLAANKGKGRLMGRRTVQRSLSRWAARGVFVFAHRKGGRTSQTTRARFNILLLKLENGQVNPAKMADRIQRSKKSFRKDQDQDQKPLFVVGAAKSKEITVPTARTEEPFHSQDLPSQTQSKPESKAPVAFNNPDQVAKWFKLRRKLKCSVSDEQAKVFDDLHHTEKIPIINGMEREEQIKAARGEVPPPPPKPPAPRHTLVERPTPLPTRERTACGEGQHRWTAPASDGVSQCAACGEETGEMRIS